MYNVLVIMPLKKGSVQPNARPIEGENRPVHVGTEESGDEDSKRKFSTCVYHYPQKVTRKGSAHGEDWII
jgi:hypothetical protein